MSIILSQEYGHAMLEHLDVFDLCVLFRVDVATRTFLLSLGGTKTFEEYVMSKTFSIKDQLLMCVKLDMVDEFKGILQELDIEETYMKESGSSSESEDGEKRQKLIYKLIPVCDAAVRQGKVEFMDPFIHELRILHDWYKNGYSDCLCGFMSIAVRYNRPSVVKYLLGRNESIYACLREGLRTAGKTHNKHAATFFLDHPQMEMYSEELNSILRINDNDLYDKYIWKVDLCDLWYNNWYCVGHTLDIPLSNNNEYLYEKVCELALILTESDDVRKKIPLHRGEYTKPTLQVPGRLVCDVK